MSENMEVQAVQGARQLVDEAEQLLQHMLALHGPEAQFTFPNTVYYLPLILGSSARAVETVGDLQPVLQQARKLIGNNKATGERSDAALAAMLAAEVIEALGSPDGQFDSPLGDTQVRSRGVPLADGRIPGIALILGPANSNDIAAALVEGLRQHNVFCLLGGTPAGSLSDQLQGHTMQVDSPGYIVPLGKASTALVHALGFAARCAMRLGGYKPGTWAEILGYCRRRTPGFVIALGELSERDQAMISGASEFGFTLATDAAGALDDPQLVPQFIQKCMSARGLKAQSFRVDVPVAYGPAFEDQVIPDADVQVQFGGTGRRAFELLQKVHASEITDGRIEVIGPAAGFPEQADLGIVVKVAGARIETDFEPYLQRQIQAFINYANGAQHGGQQDEIVIRISKAAAARGFSLESIGKILQSRFHEEFGPAVEKAEITLITESGCLAEWLEKSRAVYTVRKQRVESLTDDQVDVFYVCTHCRTFAPNNVSIISPERVSPCGECNWFDAKASSVLDRAGYRRPIKPGKPIDARKGIWEGTNHYARTASHGRMEEVALYSLMQSPMGACGDFECMVVLLPEANGVMVLSHEDTSLRTPAGMTIETFSSLTAGEQIPGVVGIGKSYLLSPKFIFPEGGFKRVVWMSSRLKESMGKQLKAVCEREGDPALLDKIADERDATTMGELVRWLQAHRHPALEMEKMF